MPCGAQCPFDVSVAVAGRLASRTFWAVEVDHGFDLAAEELRC